MILQSLFRQWVVCEQTFVIVSEMESCILHKGSQTKVVLHWFIYLPTAITRRALILRYAALIPNIRREISKEKLAAWKVAILTPEQLPCIKVKIFEMLRQCSSLLLSKGEGCVMLSVHFSCSPCSHSSYVLFMSPFNSISKKWVVLSWVSELNQFSKESISCQDIHQEGTMSRRRERWGKATKSHAILLPWLFLQSVNSHVCFPDTSKKLSWEN